MEKNWVSEILEFPKNISVRGNDYKEMGIGKPTVIGEFEERKESEMEM